MSVQDIKKQFAACKREAISHTPFGHLFDADKAGLIRRARSLGLTDAQARQALNARVERPRHPITRGIE